MPRRDETEWRDKGGWLPHPKTLAASTVVSLSVFYGVMLRLDVWQDWFTFLTWSLFAFCMGRIGATPVQPEGDGDAARDEI